MKELFHFVSYIQFMRASQGIYIGGNQFISNDEIDQSNQSNHCRKQFGQFQVDIYGYTFYKEVSCLSRLVENVEGEGEEERGSESPDLSINLLLHPLFRSGVLFILFSQTLD